MFDFRNKTRWKRAALALTGIIIFLFAPLSVLAQEPPSKHENPETAEPNYNPISLLRYYSETQDFLLRRDVKTVAKRLGKIPFANVPEDLRDILDKLNIHEMELANTAAETDQSLEDVGSLMSEFRLNEALELADQLSQQLNDGYTNLQETEELVKTMGERTGAASARRKSHLGRAYNELLDRLEKVGGMFDSYKARLIELLLGARSIANPQQVKTAENILGEQEITEYQPINPSEQLNSAVITLTIVPTAAFVGDEVHFKGRLTCNGKPLPGREITLLLDGTEYTTALTGDNGWYEGVLQVPYRYVSEVLVEALYRPRGKDVGNYLASKSPAVKIKVLFYKAALALDLEDKAYPGLETYIGGSFDYENAPAPDVRDIEVYLDDCLVAKEDVRQDFSVPIKLNPETKLGTHRITVSASPQGRYAPVTVSDYLEVTRATPVVDLNLPGVALVPGNIGFTGQVSSKVGPVSGGEVELKLGETEAQANTSEDGSFSLNLKKGTGLELFGSRGLEVKVIPQESWHAPVSLNRSLFVVNWVNSGGMVLILGALGFIVRRRVSRFKLPRRHSKEGTLVPGQPIQQPLPTPSLPAEDLPKGTPQRRIVGWYQRVVRLLLRVLNIGLRPSQTLREFVREVSPQLGPVSRLFEELTHHVESVLYSGRRPTDEEARRIEKVSKQFEERVKGFGRE